ncbi:N-6 DNA methylase [Simiduia sp. 21SJ11W-1]|uniref:Eco57I restriction-modification methylase domain-containing protein n=1 Tax=Simiduia sp. 21SJ11W-1 TaxID=2909669 RepID=UPI0020A1D6B3|nr:N-6 DNA methylase [Simiduia sp. 21SJ11W-1]UTA47449.1 N-6 DNA methylase [Simiduia sp. 21SJ11W-1]
MAKHNHQTFESLRIVGALLGTQVLHEARNLKLPGQALGEYSIERGLKLNDELGRYWRIARARWQEFQSQRPRQDINPHRLAQQEWLLPLLRNVLGFTVVESPTLTLGEREFPLTHTAHNGAVPLVLCGANQDLDKGDPLFGQEGRKRSPMGLVQEYLNAESRCLWGIVSNGVQLRLLRDNPAMTRPAYVEVDLERLFEEDNYADFALFWLLAHASRFAPQDQNPEACWLEQWRNQGHSDGERALEKLRDGVTKALRELGTGFVAHPANQPLRDRLTDGSLSTDAYFQQVLRLVYRFLFLLTAEDRNQALLPEHYEGTDYKAARALYQSGYSITNLRERARLRRHHDTYTDAWQQLCVTFAGFAEGQPALAQPALGGLFAAHQCEALGPCELANQHLYKALFELCYFEHQGRLSRINYRDMDTEEFGSVYESLLELIPQLTTEGQWRFRFMGDSEDEEAAGGHARKLTGSYYTPDSLVQELIKSALEPVIAQRLQQYPAQPRDALLSISVCDPACGSGHFLLAASRRLAAELARIDAGTDQPTEAHYRHALRDVVRHCIYGVDLNPMAVELCKIALWLESIEPGQPLSFLNHHIQCGNALLGLTSLSALDHGIPKAAFKPLAGDMKPVCSALNKRNTKALKQLESSRDSNQFRLPLEQDNQLTELQSIEAMPQTSAKQVAEQEIAYRAFLDKAKASHLRQAADMVLGAFLLPKTEEIEDAIPTTASVYLELVSENHNAQHIAQRETVITACVEARVFHWPLAFPQIFAKGGFDCVLGNPPWERIKLQEEEFFSTRNADVARAKNKAERAQRIQWLSEGMLAKHLLPELHHPEHECQAEVRLFNEFVTAKHTAEAASAFVHVNGDEGGRYALTGVGDVNTYALFSETIYQIVSPMGRAGFIVPSGLATDNSTKGFFGELISKKSLDSFFEFENEGFFAGAGQGHMLRFALTTIVGSAQEIPETRFLFQGKKIEHLHDPERVFTLSPEDIFRVNPNTLTCPIFQSRYDAEITKKIYQRVPVLIREANDDQPEVNPWGIRFMAMFHMSNDSHLFKTYEDLIGEGYELDGNHFVKDKSEYVPLYESKMIQLYNHRYGDFRESLNERPHVLPRAPEEYFATAEYLTYPFYWVDKTQISQKVEASGWGRKWFIAWRRITDARASARTMIASVIPDCGSGDSLFLPLLKDFDDGRNYAAFLANLSSLVLDYFARQKLGGLNLNYFTFKQLPIISPEAYDDNDLEFIASRVVELTYNSMDLKEWGKDIGHNGNPIVYNSERRHKLRCELDAYYAKLYGLTREELCYILDPTNVAGADYPSETFRVLKSKEEKEFGEYRTQRLVLEAWDQLHAGQLE